MTESSRPAEVDTTLGKKALLSRIGDLRKEAENKATVAGLGASIGVLAPALLPAIVTAFGGDGFTLACLGVGIAAKTVGGFLLAQERMQEAGSINQEANSLEVSYYEGIRRLSGWKERALTRIEGLKESARNDLVYIGLSTAAAVLCTAVFAKAMLYVAGPTPFGVDKVFAMLHAAFFIIAGSETLVNAAPALAKRKSEVALARMLGDKLAEE